MVITDIAYNESHFTVFLIDIEKHVPLCRLYFSPEALPIFVVNVAFVNIRPGFVSKNAVIPTG